MLKSKGNPKIKTFKTDWTIKNVNKDDGKIRIESKKIDVKLGSNSTKWMLKMILDKENDAFEVFLYKKKVSNDNFNINFCIKIGTEEFQWEKKAFELESGSWGWPKLMPLDALFDDSKGYIDASGRLKVSIQVKLTELDGNLSVLDGSAVSQGFTCETCSHYFENPAFSDFTIICNDGVSLPVHRVFLAKKSPVFKTLFETEMHENKTTLTDINSKTMKEVLRYVYCGNAEIQEVDVITDVLHAAATYEIAELVSLCIDGLMDKIDKNTVMAILNLAYVYRHAELENKCLGVILKYYKELKDTENWKELNMPLIMKIMDAALNTSKHLTFQTL